MTIAVIGSGVDNMILYDLLRFVVVKYMAIKYDAAHKPAGKLFITNDGNNMEDA